MVHSDSDLILHNSSVLIDKEPLKLVEQMNQTFSAIVSNNLNNIMKILTSLTIILTIPTIVGSIYGMNIKLPIAERDDAFIWLVLLTLFICIVTTYYLKKGKFL